ncbi:MAG: glycosyltransferase family 4 protein [Opitutaceae bacterium]|nr:glycosyltransferase family 4 protein [Opitutaceae bacterium]
MVAVPSSPTIAYLFTTFPKATETFLQREVAAMQQSGLPLRLYSLWGGGGSFGGMEVRTFPKLRLIELFWIIPWASVRHPRVFWPLVRGLLSRRAPSWMNFWENMLGAGFAGVYHREFRADPPRWIHAAWGGAPATAAWILSRLNGHAFSVGAHAYDLYEHGGDWWLSEKLGDAAFVHTSTDMGAATLRERGIRPDRIHVIRRGLDRFPAFKALRPERRQLRVVCVARLVEKKGLDEQLRLYAEAGKAGIEVDVRVLGDGPLRRSLESLRDRLGLQGRVAFLGHCPLERVWETLAWADLLVHTGRVAASGDRDGLPNVIPEAMSIGTLVVTSPAAATTEAISHEVTGFVARLDDPAAWLATFRRVAGGEDATLEQIRRAARGWVEREFDAHHNAARLRALFLSGIAASSGPVDSDSPPVRADEPKGRSR